ncbi:hypothetical protein Vadar_020380 [Vaccinium darrowii]|uniref:Uncharacterized protein n=1 Tax=Vaccinium darrowii TaxID=229202 RepID=A0ACB7XJ76_9ERIC|nr:hypothetical protein Vadar_020380 [Vaccinium darrowii]
MCLQSSCTGNEFYVLEFFLPTSCKCNENILTTISLILGTMQENLKTFKLASGQELGEVLSVEVLNFQNDQKDRSIEMIKASRCIPRLEPKVGGVVLQLGQVDQSSMDAINNGMNVVSEAQTDNLPGLVPLQNGEVAMQLDSSGQQSMDPSDNGATTCVPSLEQLGQLDQASMDAINNGMNVVSEAQINNLPSLEPSQNGEEAMQLDSADHQSMDLYNGQNVGTMERNIIVVSSPEVGTRKLKDSSSRLKRIVRGYGIYRWPPRKINMVRKICWGYGIYRWLPRKINMVCHSRPLPLEDQEQIPKQPSDQASACDGNIKPASACDGNIKPGLQDASMVTIKAKYGNYNLKFKLPLSSRLEDLKQEVAKRLKNLGAGTYHVKYKDEDDELILITCDEDLQYCIHTYRSMDKSTIVVLLEPEQPITNLNPTD